MSQITAEKPVRPVENRYETGSSEAAPPKGERLKLDASEILQNAFEAQDAAEGRGVADAQDGVETQGATEVQEEKPKKQTRRGTRNKELGRRGEEAAARFLYRRGYEIVARNWTCAVGEADIIARDGPSLVFVEVKTRTDCQKGFPSEAVTPTKREKYEKIACLFLAEYDVVDIPVRFDVVSIVVVAPDRAFIRHNIDAFAAAV